MIPNCFFLLNVEDGGSVSRPTTNILSESADVGSTNREGLVVFLFLVYLCSHYLTTKFSICYIWNLYDNTVAKPPVQKFAYSSHITPRLTPEATPKIMSTSASPRRMSTTATPKLMSGATSPTRSRIEGHMSMTPWYPSSKQSSAANSPPRGRPNPGLILSGDISGWKLWCYINIIA